MQPQFFVQNNGQEVQQSDFGTLGENSALADDRALAKVLQLRPFVVGAPTKAIVPFNYGNNGGGADSGQKLIFSYPGAGSVRVSPFVAVVGSRSDSMSSTPLKNWQDIRSAVYFPSNSDARTELQAIASNASGNPRWDLIYATVQVDTNDTGVTRYVKNPTTLVVAPATVTATKSTKVILTVLAGTPAGAPVKPSLPADSGSNYNIAICYVRVPNGFNGSSNTTVHDIEEVAPVVTISSATGALNLQPAGLCNNLNLPALVVRDPWLIAGNRPRCYLPPSMTGGASRIIPFNFLDAPNNAIDGDVIDNSIDWRSRVFRWNAQVTASSTRFGWDPTASTLGAPSAWISATAPIDLSGMSQSFLADLAAGKAAVAAVCGSAAVPIQYRTPALPASTRIVLYVDMSTGELKLSLTGTAPAAVCMFWVDASAQFTP